MAKRKKKVIAPGNASKRRAEESREKAKPENRFNIPKPAWWGLVAMEAVLLLICFFTGNLIFGVPAVALAFFIEHFGMDVLLEDYNEMVGDRRERLGLPRDPSEDDSQTLSDTMRRERIAKRKERKERKIAEGMGLSYEDYLEAARLAEEREARMGADQAAEGADGRGSKNSAADADPSLPEGVEAGSPESLSLSPQWEGDERIDLCHAHICV